jgi:hypothetical protein
LRAVVVGHLQAGKRCLDIGEAALRVPPLARDRVIGSGVFGNGRPIDMQHAQILKDRQGSVEERARSGNAHANHPNNHVASPLSPIVCATAHRANSSRRWSVIAVILSIAR